MNTATTVLLIILSNLVTLQLFILLHASEGFSNLQDEVIAVSAADRQAAALANADTKASWNPYNPLEIPKGSPPNLPSVRVEDKVDRGIYGGKGDKEHLGGFTLYDGEGVSPAVWRYMIQNMGVHSLMDLGCGKGVSTRWFYEHNVDVLCLEGSHDAVTQSYLPPENIVEHDFSRGPWWPEKTYDAVWSVEFLEHVSRQYQFNYMTVFRKAALAVFTHSRWGGYHHTEVHWDDWWIRKFQSYGFIYSEELSAKLRDLALKERQGLNASNVGPDGEKYRPNHVVRNAKVFINPAVASLPQHNHLFPEDGCFERYNEKGPGKPPVTRPCNRKGETPLDPSFEPLPVTDAMHQKWLDVISTRLKEAQKTQEANKSQ